MNQIAFGKRVKENRNALNLSSDALSEIYSSNPVTIRQIESAARLPSFEKFVLLFNCLQVLPSVLLTDSLDAINNQPFESLWERLCRVDSLQAAKVTSVINTVAENEQAQKSEAGFDRRAFGERIRTLRLELDMTAKALSKLCKMSSVFIQHIEHGDRLPSLPSFVKICNTLHVSPNHLLVDSIYYKTDSELDNLYRLALSLTPKQITIVSSMLDAIL